MDNNKIIVFKDVKNSKNSDVPKTFCVFEHKKIRRILHNEEWYFSVVDVIIVLTNSLKPRQYWGKVKDREFKALELSPIWIQLKLLSSDGKSYLTDCANTKNMFRIIQSIPSKKAEPFKQWLAQVGYERIKEIENPEIGQDRIKKYYELKGYPKEWIDKRLRGIAIRQELTAEWKNRKIKTEKDFAILTNEISKATFGKNIGEYKEFKKIKRNGQNLRDHMTDWELILTMFGEKATTDITIEKNSQGFNQCKKSANKGGSIAKRARKDLEKNIGRSVISKKNFLSVKKRKLIKK